jgi:hypothetical protein
MKADDAVKGIFLRKMDQFGEDALNSVAHVQTRISVIVTSREDSHHIQFPEPATRAQLACMLRDLADAVCRGKF